MLASPGLYEDQDDADTLRHNPLLKFVCGRRPHEPGADLASQPTLSRLENAVDRRAGYRLASALVAIYLQERERAAGGVPAQVLLDLDSTDDPTHGEQEGSSYHGYYRQHMYHPLLVFDGHTKQLITAVLRHGAVHASRCVGAIPSRLVAAIRTRWPHVAIELRADSGFALPALYAYGEHEQIDYTIGLAPMRDWRHWLPHWSSGPSRGTSRPGRRCVCWPKRATPPIPGPTSAASSTPHTPQLQALNSWSFAPNGPVTGLAAHAARPRRRLPARAGRREVGSGRNDCFRNTPTPARRAES